MMQNGRWFHPLLAPEDGSGGGGGGEGGGGEGEGEGNGAPAMSADEMKRMMANMVNSAVNSHFKRDSFQQLIASSVKDAFAEIAPKREESEPPKVEDHQGDKKPDARDAELAKMRSEQERMKAALEAQRAEAEAEKNKAREQAERSVLTDALRAGGVDENRMRAAVAYLYLDAKRIKRDEDDNIVMTFKRDWGEELVPVEKGISEYLKSDEGKVFLPPVDTSGSGNKGGRPPSAKGAKPTRAELLENLGRMMMRGG